MNIHKNARLSVKGRELLIDRLERGEHARAEGRPIFLPWPDVEGKWRAQYSK